MHAACIHRLAAPLWRMADAVGYLWHFIVLTRRAQLSPTAPPPSLLFRPGDAPPWKLMTMTKPPRTAEGSAKSA